MAEVVTEKEVCEKCGVDVRENTAFCYNCGASVSPPADDAASATNGDVTDVDRETKAALDDLADKFKIDEEADGRLAKAAAERRRKRVSNRKSVRYEWQPTDDAPNTLFILLTVVIAVLAAVAVLLTVFWK